MKELFLIHVNEQNWDFFKELKNKEQDHELF